HLERLANATDEDVRLTENSPSTIPFWSLRTADGEINRDEKIESGDPGSTCPNGFLKFDTEFTDKPLCIASKSYLRKKLDEISNNNYDPAQIKYLREKILARTCLCRDLCGSFERKYHIDDNAKPIICCGPNILNFKKIFTLPDMVSHIYGRISLLASAERAHVFINELVIYVDFLKKELKEFSLELSDRMPKYFNEYKDNLLSGIDYYNKFSEHLEGETRKKFLKDLSEIKQTLISLYGGYFECEAVT
ncbi:MAG: hypothetical protein JW738_08805, partial [Actinobacteria bacterium]|nr:hypothetical protein [Actinomycetota bacterium]